MRTVVSNRVLVAFALLLALLGASRSLVVRPPPPQPLAGSRIGALREIEVVHQNNRVRFAFDKDEAPRLVGPDEVVAAESKRLADLDRVDQSAPSYSGLAGSGTPSVFRRQRLESLADSVRAMVTRSRVVWLVPATDSADRALYGTATPHLSVTVVGTTATVRIAVGAPTAEGLGRYAECEGHPGIAVIPVSWVGSLERLAGLTLVGD